MKSNIFIQHDNKEVTDKDILAAVKADIKEKAIMKISEIKTLNIYYVPAEGKAYYVLNDEHKDSISM